MVLKEWKGHTSWRKEGGWVGGNDRHPPPSVPPRRRRRRRRKDMQ